MQKVKFRCKGCGWTKTLPATWADVKPRFCPTPTCEVSVKKSKGRKSFRNNPDMLEMSFYEAHSSSPIEGTSAVTDSNNEAQASERQDGQPGIESPEGTESGTLRSKKTSSKAY